MVSNSTSKNVSKTGRLCRLSASKRASGGPTGRSLGAVTSHARSVAPDVSGASSGAGRTPTVALSDASGERRQCMAFLGGCGGTPCLAFWWVQNLVFSISCLASTGISISNNTSQIKVCRHADANPPAISIFRELGILPVNFHV